MNDPKSQEYEKIGRTIIENLKKLMSGEHMGRAVVVPIKAKCLGSGQTMTRITIDMPSLIEYKRSIGPKGYDVEVEHYTWVPESQAYVLNDFIYKEKK